MSLTIMENNMGPRTVPSKIVSKFGDKAVHDYSLFPVTKKADNPIDNIRINSGAPHAHFAHAWVEPHS